jgi:lysophospholipase L1-like esterase
MLLAPKTKFLLIGDSITDCGRTKSNPPPAGGTGVSEGLFDPLGRGYVTMVEALLGACYPQLGIRVLNTGNSGHTVKDLKARWKVDVLDQKPDWLSVMIGINDVWRQFDSPRQTETHVLPDEYERTYDELLAQTRALLKGLVLMTPFYIEPNPADRMRARMDEYGAIVKKLASRHGAVLVDTQAAFNRTLDHYYAGTLAWDRVHPNQTGHMILAKALLDALGFSWS